MRKLMYLLFGLAILAMMPVVLSVYLYKTTNSTTEKMVFIEPKTGVRELIAQLHAEGLVPSPMLTLIPVIMTADYHLLKAGEYEFPAGSTPAQVIDQIIRGEVVIHKVTIPDGWDVWQVKAALMAEQLLTGELPVIAEGSLLPDTIHFSRGEARSSVIARMQKAQSELMEKLWANHAADLPYQSPAQALVLASIVEKETGIGGERGKVAGVFVNRLRLGMPLQSDPTVVYGIELRNGGMPMGRALSKLDLKTDTAHNTYTRAGLPPTPICNPGRAAIEAVLNPTPTDALYFVATGNGGHNFSATLGEHERFVDQYRAVLKDAQKR
ncbi:MAG: endolytic transglycosylase MltG [Rickettsiales bacterium]